MKAVGIGDDKELNSYELRMNYFALLVLVNVFWHLINFQIMLHGLTMLWTCMTVKKIEFGLSLNGIAA